MKVMGQESDSPIPREIQNRKKEHIDFTLRRDVSVKGSSTLFDQFYFLPNPIPDVDYDEIDLSTEFLGRKFAFPVLVAGMTGGYAEAEAINKGIARACEDLNIPMGVGSQRAGIEHPDLEKTYQIKDEAPTVFTIGNLGLVQFNKGYTVEDARKAIQMINADALAIHVNAFQELAQPEGDRNFKGLLLKLKDLVTSLDTPIILKEVGSGIPWEDAVTFETMGVAAIDVGGSGGTSWAKIEVMRANELTPHSSLIMTEDDPLLLWGVPTALSTYEVTSKTHLPVIATGGMYHGLDAAKALAMGASMVGIARPILQAYKKNGVQGVKDYLFSYTEQIKRVMFLLGVKTINELKQQRSRLIPFGFAREWLTYRGFI